MQRILSMCEHAYQWARQKIAPVIEADFDPVQHASSEDYYHKIVDSPGFRRR